MEEGEEEKSSSRRIKILIHCGGIHSDLFTCLSKARGMFVRNCTRQVCVCVHGCCVPPAVPVKTVFIEAHALVELLSALRAN